MGTLSMPMVSADPHYCDFNRTLHAGRTQLEVHLFHEYTMANDQAWSTL